MKLIQGTYPETKKHLQNLLSGAYFEFSLPYVEEGCTFREIDRFNDESRRLTRFRNRYTGNVAINLTEWAEKPFNCYLTAFIYFLLDRMLDYPESTVVLICEKACSDNFIFFLEDHFGEELEITDLGVKESATDRRIIGFVAESEHISGRKPGEGRRV